MIRSIKLWLSMTWFEAQRFRAYPLEIVAGVVARLAETILYTVFWFVIAKFSPPGTIPPITTIVSYYLIISGLAPFFYVGFGIASQTIELIKTGTLSQTLIRPINPIWYPWALRTGRDMVELVFGALQVIIGVSLGGGLRPEALPFLLPVLWNTLTINAAFNIFIGACAFYATDGRNLKNIFLHAASFLRGERMPIYLMTPSFAHILMLTPFPASLYHLTIMLQGNRLPTWPDVLVGVLWSVVLLAGSLQFWRISIKRYEAAGI